LIVGLTFFCTLLDLMRWWRKKD